MRFGYLNRGNKSIIIIVIARERSDRGDLFI
jgi:hypothetical protein